MSVQGGLPHPVVMANGESGAQLGKDFEGEKTGWCLIGPKRYCLPSKYKDQAARIHSLEVRPDDVWIVTFPRSGTTMTQEMVWLLKNHLDFKAASERQLWDRSPFLEFNLFFHDSLRDELLEQNEGNPTHQDIIRSMSSPIYDIVDSMEGPRVIKTHIPISLLPKDFPSSGAKVIYVARHPKSVIISMYHLMKLWRTSGFVGTFEDFYDHFENDQVGWAPYWAHLMEGWNNRNLPNYLFLFYEDMIKDLRGTIEKLAGFLGVDINEEQIERLVDHMDINNFKNNTAVNFESLRDVGILKKGEQPFIRKGEVNGQGDEWTPFMLKRLNKWINDNCSKTDLKFPV